MNKSRIIFIIIAFTLFVFPMFTFAATNEYEITAIDYGPESEGDATLIGNNGHYLLIDTSNYASDEDAYGNPVTNKEDKVIKYLQDRGITNLDLYITHYHNDHLRYAVKILEEFNVGKIYLPNIYYIERFSGEEYSSYDWYSHFAPTGGSSQLVKYNNIVTKAQERGTTIVTLNKGVTFNVGNISAKVIWMENGDDESVYGGLNNTKFANDYINNCSTVTMYTMGNIKYLNAGDIEDEVEAKLLSNNIDVKADIFKLSHHGSPSSNTEDFLNAINPKYLYAMFNYDTETDFGGKSDSAHYRIESYNRYMNHGNLYTSRYNGTTTFKITGKEIEVTTVRNKKTVTFNYYDTDTNELIKTRKVDYNSAANYYVENILPEIENYEFDADNENNSSFVDGMPPTNDMELKFYYKKVSDPEEDVDEDDPTPTPSPTPDKDEEYVSIPDTFSGKNGTFIIIGGLLIASGSFVIIKRLYV